VNWAINMRVSRRAALAGGAAGLLWGCARDKPETTPHWSGGFVGDAVALGHRWRDGGFGTTERPIHFHRCDVLIVGAGIAGLAAARALREAGIEDLVLLELHDQAGGNSRSHAVAGLECPIGAHYLPVPQAEDHELLRWLHEIGLARHEMGRTVFEERHLCHSPQERVWHEGQWHEGLLPPLTAGTDAYEQAGRLTKRIDRLAAESNFTMPSTRLAWQSGHETLDRQTFANWLDKEGITDSLLRWYLDYCCLDDYGATASVVSAWAGVHYFASRHGFHAPGLSVESVSDGVFTWPEGNQWLVRQLALPMGARIKPGWWVSQVSEWRDRVTVRAHAVPQAASSAMGTVVPAPQEWAAKQVILALPLAWSNRLLGGVHAPLQRAAQIIKASPWLLGHVRLDGALIDRPGAAPAWDNIVAGKPSLGYVDARHQTLGAPGSTGLLTAYHALPLEQRAGLLDRSWADWSRWVVQDLAATHADLPEKVRRVDIVRHGHAMSVPLPGLRGSADLAALRQAPLSARVQVAHSDLVGYSVFEEAFALGLKAGRRAAQRLGGKAPRRS
jgi:monoamine oxidase